jgi:hypothetical protein
MQDSFACGSCITIQYSPLFFGGALIGRPHFPACVPVGGRLLLIAEGLGPERGEPGGIGAIEGDLNS